MTLSPDMPAHFHHAPTFAQVRAELARELAARAGFYPSFVSKGRMSQSEADWQLQIFRAIAEDLEAVIALRVRNLSTERQAFSWADKRRALLRELDHRQRFYPDWIRKGRFDQAEGTRRTTALAAMLALYDDGLRWQPDPPDCPAEIRRSQWRAIAAELAPAQPQKELAL